MTNPDPESVSWLRIVLAFAVVFGLMGLLAFALKYINVKGLRLPGMTKPESRRLQIIESLALDARRRVVIVRCDNREHLLLLGAGTDVVVQTDLPSAPRDSASNT